MRRIRPYREVADLPRHVSLANVYGDDFVSAIVDHRDQHGALPTEIVLTLPWRVEVNNHLFSLNCAMSDDEWLIPSELDGYPAQTFEVRLLNNADESVGVCTVGIPNRHIDVLFHRRFPVGNGPVFVMERDQFLEALDDLGGEWAFDESTMWNEVLYIRAPGHR